MSKLDERGFFRKYAISRTDGSSAPGGKHENCTYFVLDLNHDPHAIPALRAYAKSCKKTHPQLSLDLTRIIETPEQRPCGCREAHCPHSQIFDGPSSMAEYLLLTSEKKYG